ncbi:hypothetical protein MIND_00077600 [Mycena indigotica]|uniref:DUF1168-domain-containing protein n=1 Tax=Mycena indigotica TaxID=2126181 RepID=A0A8H6TF51_9AGAR|nr:uncharacterized protein MIND_00077600 [Mycena indigotica]KAF7315622.1 hypothetical protein MIND_00077600 [Mycena indigotica]
MASTSSSSTTPRYAITAVDKQRSALDKLLKDPQKPAFIPTPPQDKTIRPAREMMKNVQGSSAGAGSGEFHVYKASRRREYERIKLIEETAQKETDTAEFERKRKEAEALAESKTAKNRAKRQKKKERAKGKGESNNNKSTSEAPLKKRRLVNGQELVFRKPGEGSDSEGDEEVGPQAPVEEKETVAPLEGPEIVDTAPRIVFHDDD